MRRYESHENAKRRLEERRRERNRVELDDLMHYLEDVSSEPAGEEAYGLALCLRRMSLPADNLFALLRQVQDRLSDFHDRGGVHGSMRESLDKVARFLDVKLREKGEGAAIIEAPIKKEKEAENASQQPAFGPNRTEDPELTAACSHGHAVSRSIRDHYKWQLFHNMVALAIFWTCFKPSSQPSREPTPWIEGDVIRMFP
jgi:hypothetical protein